MSTYGDRSRSHQLSFLIKNIMDVGDFFIIVLVILQTINNNLIIITTTRIANYWTILRVCVKFLTCMKLPNSHSNPVRSLCLLSPVDRWMLYDFR